MTLDGEFGWIPVERHGLPEGYELLKMGDLEGQPLYLLISPDDVHRGICLGEDEAIDTASNDWGDDWVWTFCLGLPDGFVLLSRRRNRGRPPYRLVGRGLDRVLGSLDEAMRLALAWVDYEAPLGAGIR